MGCCSKNEEEESKWVKDRYVDGALLNNRSCTDCPCILIFIIFLMGWAVVLGVAFAEGSPQRILMPSNFRGDLCGDGYLSDYPNYFAPLPNRPEYGVCVEECPAVMTYMCNNDVEPQIGNASNAVPNHYYSHTVEEFAAGKNAVAACLVSCTAAEEKASQRFTGLMLKLEQSKCFLAFYQTFPALYRCLPINLDLTNKSIMEQANTTLSTLTDLADTLGFGSFFMRGFAECKQTWPVILICCGTAVIISMIWIFLLRWIMAPIVYLCILLILAILILVGVLAMLQADDLEKVKLPGQTGTEDQVKVWRAIEYIFYLTAAIYVVAMLFMIKRIRIAIIMMEESSKAFLANPVMIVLPLIVLVLLVGFAALFIAGTVYIQTMDDVSYATFRNDVVTFIGQDTLNKTELALASGSQFVNDIYAFNVSTNANLDINVSSYDSTTAMKALHAYNFFMLLWMGNFWIMFAFFVMALIVSTWYFSATTAQMDAYEMGLVSEGTAAEKNVGEARLKSTKVGTFAKAICVTLRYHLGTIIFGALLIAIIQFIRAVVLYIERKFLDKWKNDATVKALICVLNCCLACIERLVRAISKGAFVITCVTNESFCFAAQESLGIMITNLVQTGALQGLSLAACTVLKIFIAGTNLLVGFGLIHVEKLTDDRSVESGLFPLFFIGCMSLAIACLFVNIFESCVDTIMMCYFIDEKRFDGVFMPPALSKLVGKFKEVEKARKLYEEQMRAVTKGM